MPLRCTVDTEYREGPDYWFTIQNGTGHARLILFRKPIISITSIQVSPNIFPRQYVTVPAGFYEVQYPPIGFYGTTAPSSDAASGQSIILSSGYVDWSNGRNGWIVKVVYENGYPHTSLTSNASAGTTTLACDDCTGWVGATGVVYDSGLQEVVQVTGTSATSGPGNLTLATATQFAHQPGVLVSTLPASVQQAAIWLCAAEALTRGATSTTVHQIPGGGGGSGGNVNSPDALIKRAHCLLDPFRRTI